MKKEDLFELGYIAKPVGNKGEISMHIDSDQPDYYSTLQNLFIDIRGTLVPYFVERIKIRGAKATVKFKDIDKKEVVELLQGNKVFLPLELLPKLKGNQFYFHEVIGFEVIDKEKGGIGTIDQVIDQSVQAIFSIMKDGQEILIPVTDDILKKVDRKKKQIQIEAPEGLIDLYLE